MFYVHYFLHVDSPKFFIYIIYLICKKIIPNNQTIIPILCMMKFSKTPQYGNGEAGGTGH